MRLIKKLTGCLCALAMAACTMGASAAVLNSTSISAQAAEVKQIGPGGETPVREDSELRGVWISYLEWESMPKEKAAFQKKVDEMLDNCVKWGMNSVFVHAHSHTDAMYPSDLLPWSKFASGTQGKNPGYDPFGYLVTAAHSRGLQVHAWFNPYRVTGYHMTWDAVSSQSPAKQWLSDATTANDRWVLKQGGQYYLNPAVPEVQQLVVDSVKEVMTKYPVDGIHFDDYFYPEVNDSSEATWFDKPEYDKSGSTLSITNWRKENVSSLIGSVYRAVKETNSNVVFGVSPQGYLKNLRSSTSLFVDIDKWMSNTGYLDYIMPQLYWGFTPKLSSGELAPYAFENNLKSWIALKKTGSVKLYLGLGMYRAGTNVSDHNATSEWLTSSDIMKRQVEGGRSSGQVSGYCFFSYSSFLESTSKKEVENLLPLFK